MQRWFHRIPAALFCLSGLFVLACLFETVRLRIAYPFDLEWMEGGMLVHALRVRDGLPLYTTPTADFIPFIYPPLYPWLLGVLGNVFSLDATLGRAVSLLGILCASGALVWAVRREGNSWPLGIATAALFLSTYDDVGAFFDLVRTDGLMIALLAGALLTAREATPRAVAASGLLLTGAYLSKHSMALHGLPILFWLWKTQGKGLAMLFIKWSVVPALLITGALQLATDGWFLTYILEIPSTHPLVADRLFPESEKELLSAFPIAIGCAFLASVLLRFTPRADLETAPVDSDGRLFWIANTGVGLLLTILMRAHHGGFLNVLIPGYWFLALCCGLAFGEAMKRWAHPSLRIVLATVVVGSVLMGRWEPKKYAPTDADVQAVEQIIEAIQTFEGEVLIPHAPHYAVLAGKSAGFHQIALWDVVHDGASTRKETKQSLTEAIAAQRYDAIILANEKFAYGLKQHYRKTKPLRFKSKAGMPKTGWRARPRFVFVPKEKGARVTPPVDKQPTTPDETAP